MDTGLAVESIDEHTWHTRQPHRTCMCETFTPCAVRGDWRYDFHLHVCVRCVFAGESLRVAAREGQSVYEVALKHDVHVGDCYTCHVVLSPESYAAHDKPLDEVLKTIFLVSMCNYAYKLPYGIFP